MAPFRSLLHLDHPVERFASLFRALEIDAEIHAEGIARIIEVGMVALSFLWACEAYAGNGKSVKKNTNTEPSRSLASVLPSKSLINLAPASSFHEASLNPDLARRSTPTACSAGSTPTQESTCSPTTGSIQTNGLIPLHIGK